MSNKILSRSFYTRSPELVARELLGKVLVHQLGDVRLKGRIIEVEAYLGVTDPASHSFIGRTPRTEVLFGPPGIAYVYFIYGLHYCLNVTCLWDGEPGAVLFRALLPLEGLRTMAKLRGLSAEAKPKELTGGPGRLCEAFGINRQAINGIDFTARRSPLQIVDDGDHPHDIKVTPRIGISKAADMPLRFLYVNVPKQ
jgi:DNA-3-methyladenine glycosylase